MSYRLRVENSGYTAFTACRDWRLCPFHIGTSARGIYFRYYKRLIACISEIICYRYGLVPQYVSQLLNFLIEFYFGLGIQGQA